MTVFRFAPFFSYYSCLPERRMLCYFSTELLIISTMPGRCTSMRRYWVVSIIVLLALAVVQWCAMLRAHVMVLDNIHGTLSKSHYSVGTHFYPFPWQRRQKDAVDQMVDAEEMPRARALHDANPTDRMLLANYILAVYNEHRRRSRLTNVSSDTNLLNLISDAERRDTDNALYPYVRAMLLLEDSFKWLPNPRIGGDQDTSPLRVSKAWITNPERFRQAMCSYQQGLHKPAFRELPQ